MPCAPPGTAAPARSRRPGWWPSPGTRRRRSPRRAWPRRPRSSRTPRAPPRTARRTRRCRPAPGRSPPPGPRPRPARNAAPRRPGERAAPATTARAETKAAGSCRHPTRSRPGSGNKRAIKLVRIKQLIRSCHGGNSAVPPASLRHASPVSPRYKWIALSNTTLGMLMATINSSIMLIALPDIFRGIGINPLQPGNTTILLWMMMGFLVVTGVLVVSFGRLGDMFGRVRMYNMGFAVFALFSILLSVTWMQGTAAGWYLIAMRIFQGVGGAMLMANSSAILTDAFPASERGLALGLNQVAGIAGSFIGLVLGGVLGPIHWRYVFLVSVPFGAGGTVWSYLKLREAGVRQPARLDWWGNLTFAAGLIAVLVGITYGIQPYGGHVMGWSSPLVLSLIIGGVVVLAAFCVIETRVPDPMFRLSLFRIRAFTFGNLASLLSGLGRGGLMFILIIWLQGIYLPCTA